MFDENYKGKWHRGHPGIYHNQAFYVVFWEWEKTSGEGGIKNLNKPQSFKVNQELLCQLALECVGRRDMESC